MSLIQTFKNSAARNAEKVAIAVGEESWTYSEFDRLTEQIARNLLRAGAEPGDRVALHLLNGPELALAYLGCFKAGCIAVPINPRLKGREIDYILRHSGSVFYIGQPDLCGEAAASCPAMVELDGLYLTGADWRAGSNRFDDLLSGAGEEISLPEIDPDRVAAIHYTSGTTARPKGVVHSHETLRQMARAMHEMGLDEEQVVLVMSSMSHMIGFGMLLLPALLNGASTVITRPFEFGESLDALARWGCTYTLGLPLMFRLLLETQLAAGRDIRSGKSYYCGGDCVSPALQKAFAQTFGPVYEAYGATEIAPACWNRPGENRVGSIGKPGFEMQMRLIDSRGREVEPGDTGEICVRGPHLMVGYWQDAEITAATLRDGWFHTGDLAYRDADGFYWFAGRKKEIIVRGGSNISPQEVESVLSEHPAVAEAAVVGQPHTAWGEIVVAHVVLAPGQRVDERELIAFARERLADYKVPESVIFRDALPKGPTGKLQRRALREVVAERVGA